MKKIFTLLATALMAVTASAADNLWEVTSDADVAAGTTLIDNDVLTVKNVYATKGVINNVYTDVIIDDHTFTYSFEVISSNNPDADNPNGTEYTFSKNKTTLEVNVKKKTTVTAYYLHGSNSDLKVLNHNDFANNVTPSTAFAQAGEFYGTKFWGATKYDVEPGTYVFYAKSSAINLYGLSWTSEGGDTPAPADNVIYSWSSTGDDGVTETGGKISYENGDGDRLNYSNSGYWTICLNGKKAKMGESPASADAGYMKLVLDQPLQKGDKLEIYGYITKNDASKKANTHIEFKDAEGKTVATIDESDSYPNIDPVLGEEPGTHTIDVPDAAAGCNTMYLTRNTGGTNVFIISLKVTREGGDTPEPAEGALVFTPEVFNPKSLNVEGLNTYSGDVEFDGKTMTVSNFPFSGAKFSVDLTIKANQSGLTRPSYDVSPVKDGGFIELDELFYGSYKQYTIKDQPSEIILKKDGENYIKYTEYVFLFDEYTASQFIPEQGTKGYYKTVILFLNGKYQQWTDGAWGEAKSNGYLQFEVNVPNVEDKTGIDDIVVDSEDENAPVEYYNLQGVRISEPAAGQIVIRRQGSKVQKLLVR